MTIAVEYTNSIFASVFFFEMLLKLGGYGLFEYIRNPYNLFDSVIVFIRFSFFLSSCSIYIFTRLYHSHPIRKCNSIYEVIKQVGGVSSSGGGGADLQSVQASSSGVSVLRTFRLLRILKLVRFMPALRRQLLVMLKTFDNVATFFSLLLLFIFIFSILGMNLFGCKFCIKLEDGSRLCERKNFDSLLWACITVFQVLTQEDWNEVLYNGMDRTSSWAALYFIALMTFGNYILFNLLVAILVEGFSTEDEPKKIEDRIREDARQAIAEIEEEERASRRSLSTSHSHSSTRTSASKRRSIATSINGSGNAASNKVTDIAARKKSCSVSAHSSQREPSLYSFAGSQHNQQQQPTQQAQQFLHVKPPIITHTSATPPTMSLNSLAQQYYAATLAAASFSSSPVSSTPHVDGTGVDFSDTRSSRVGRRLHEARDDSSSSSVSLLCKQRSVDACGGGGVGRTALSDACCSTLAARKLSFDSTLAHIMVYTLVQFILMSRQNLDLRP